MTLNILVALQPGDGFTPAALRARELATASAEPVNVYLCSVLFDEHIEDHRAGDHAPVGEMKQAMIAAEETVLAGVATHIEGVCQVVSQEVRWGSPVVEELVSAAAACQADLVIATAHHHSKLARLAFAQADWELMRLSSVPVLFAHYESFRPYQKVIAAVDPVHIWDRSAQLDGELIRASKRLAKPFDGEVFIGNAYPIAGLCVMAEYAPPGEIFTQWREEHKVAMAKLADANDIDAAHIRMLGDDPKRAIPELVESLNADLVVMGSVSRRNKRRVIGQNAALVLDKVDCDVLVVGSGSIGKLVSAASVE